jgi:hypothetical protein
MRGGDEVKMICADMSTAPGIQASATDGAADGTTLSPDAEEKLREAGEFFFERAEKEHEAAERKREAAMTKAAAIATLAVALAAIVATPAFDLAGNSHGAGRWLLLASVVGLLGSTACAARVFLIQVRPGARVSLRELDNWTSEEFWLTDRVAHHLALTKAFVQTTAALRRANERAESWMVWSAIGIAASLLPMVLVFMVEAF